jgi:hypothetical protein
MWRERSTSIGLVVGDNFHAGGSERMGTEVKGVPMYLMIGRDVGIGSGCADRVESDLCVRK